MLPNLEPTFDEYGPFQPTLWNTPPTTKSSSTAQSDTPYPLSMALDDVHLPVDSAVDPFQVTLPYRSDGFQLQCRGNDLDPPTNTPILPQAFDGWSRRPSYDEMLPHHRPNY